MNFKLMDTGASDILSSYFDGSNTFQIMLWVNNITLADTSTLTEAAGGGYTRQSVTATDCAPSLSSGIAYVAIAPKTFSFTGGLTTNPDVYGYALVKNGTNTAVFAEQLTTKFTPSAGGSLEIDIQAFRLGNGTPT